MKTAIFRTRRYRIKHAAQAADFRLGFSAVNNFNFLEPHTLRFCFASLNLSNHPNCNAGEFRCDYFGEDHARTSVCDKVFVLKPPDETSVL